MSFDLEHALSKDNVTEAKHITASGWDHADIDGFVEIKWTESSVDKYLKLTRLKPESDLTPSIKYKVTNYADPIAKLHFETR